jgi:hypothetical protein
MVAPQATQSVCCISALAAVSAIDDDLRHSGQVTTM